MSVANIVSKDDFVRFVLEIRKDYETSRETWKNQTVDKLLHALASGVEDMDGYYLNSGQEVPQDVQWKVFADILNGARVYS